MSKELSIMSVLKERICREREAEERLSDADLMARVERGDSLGVRAALVCFTPPSRLAGRLDSVLTRAEAVARRAAAPEKAGLLRLVTFLSIDLASAVPAWGQLKSLPPEARESASQDVLGFLRRFAAGEPEAEKQVLGELRRDAVARFKAEALTDGAEIEALADSLAGSSLCAFAEQTIREIRQSPLRRAAEAFHEGRLASVFGNDYAEFLPLVIWLGGSFVTTNPVLIKTAWDIDPVYWNRHVEEVILSRFSRDELRALLAGGAEGTAAAIASIVTSLTISVVERNCRMLRPIFLATGGEQGYVSLQVDPTAHDDPTAMAADAAAIYAEMERRLGGVPNVVIKVPSTAAGLKAAQSLTARGIGVTITLTFSLFQAVPFAEVLARGQALVSYIAIMNGRLAFPVRDEMTATKVRGGADAARLAGVEVARKAHRLLYGPQGNGGLGVDPRRVKIMIASLRVYGEWIPDVTELWGVPLITIFPNIRRAYDAAERSLSPHAVNGTTPGGDLRTLMESEIFRQAWWTETDGPVGRPQRPLSLQESDSGAVSQWAPVRETLTQFIGNYREMGDMVRARMKALCGTGGL